MKGELNFYRKYCDCAAELTGRDRRSSIFLDYRCMRKELPILHRNLANSLKNVQERAKIACAESKGTSAEEIACAVNREIQKWELGVRQEIIWNISNVVLVLKSKIPPTPESKEILDMIEFMKYEKDLTRQYSLLSIIIELIPTVHVIPV